MLLRRYRASSSCLPRRAILPCNVRLRRYHASSSYLPSGCDVPAVGWLHRYRASSSYLPYFASFSGWILLRRYRASRSYLPHNFVRIHAHRLRKYGVSSDCSLGINMDFPTLMLRRHRIEQTLTPQDSQGQARACFEGNSLRATAYPYQCLSLCIFTRLPSSATS